MTRDEVRSRVWAYAADFFGVESDAIAEDMGVGSLAGWDSTSHVGFMLGLEDELGIEFGVENLGDFETLGQLTDGCVALLASQTA